VAATIAQKRRLCCGPCRADVDTTAKSKRVRGVVHYGPDGAPVKRGTVISGNIVSKPRRQNRAGYRSEAAIARRAAKKPIPRDHPHTAKAPEPEEYSYYSESESQHHEDRRQPRTSSSSSHQAEQRIPPRPSLVKKEPARPSSSSSQQAEQRIPPRPILVKEPARTSSSSSQQAEQRISTRPILVKKTASSKSTPNYSVRKVRTENWIDPDDL